MDRGLAADLAVGGVCGWIQGFSESAEMASGDPAAEAADNQMQLGSVHTASFPALLQRLRISLAVTTYQAGKLVLLRSNAGHLNTHFCGFPKPMGLALRGPQLAVGTRNSIVEFHANEAAAVFAGAADSCDRCYVQRLSHVTGNIQIHEMEWVGDELWFVNTLFSCLAVRSSVHSFEPRWQPSFISALAPEDRCHLNGLGLRDGEIRYVTALGRSDTAGGWRPGKKDGGLLLDVAAGEVVAGGLSMPHSPRWYRDRLWLLESGTGTLGAVDVASGRYEAAAALPGFTRGLDFCGRVAFVGLSQVRESALFSGIPITAPGRERICGVAAVDLETGELLGWVKFDEGVQEIFAVRVLAGCQQPEVLQEDQSIVDGVFILPDTALQRVPMEYSVGTREAGAISEDRSR